MMTRKHKSSDAGNLDMPERSHKGLPLSENVKILDLIMKEKTLYAEIYSKNKFSVHEIVEKENLCKFCCHLILQELHPQYVINA